MKLFSALFKPSLTVKLEVDPQFLADLFERGQIHAADFRCLDFSSKQIVWKMLLLRARTRQNDSGDLLQS